MKVLHFASGDLWAGAEVQLFHLAKKMAGMHDIELLVVLLNSGRLEDELRKYNVQVSVLDESTLSGMAILKRLNALVNKFRPDIIHTHRNKENVIGSLVAKWNGIKSIRTVHGASELSTGLLNMRRLVFDGLDRFSGVMLQQKIVAVSADLKLKLAAKYPSNKIEIIENCVDVDYVKTMAEQASKNLLDQEIFNVAFVGRFVPVKRTDLFYMIAKSVLSLRPAQAICFHMIGDGPLQAGVALDIKRDDLESKVLLHGFVENVAPLLKQMDLLIFTSDHEGLPMTLLEAMTLEVPVLSRNLPSIKKVLCDGNCGFIVESDIVDDFSNIILSLANKELSSTDKIKMAREAIDENYNIAANAEKYVDLYKQVLAS